MQGICRTFSPCNQRQRCNTHHISSQRHSHTVTPAPRQLLRAYTLSYEYPETCILAPSTRRNARTVTPTHRQYPETRTCSRQPPEIHAHTELPNPYRRPPTCQQPETYAHNWTRPEDSTPLSPTPIYHLGVSTARDQHCRVNTQRYSSADPQNLIRSQLHPE